MLLTLHKKKKTKRKKLDATPNVPVDGPREFIDSPSGEDDASC